MSQQVVNAESSKLSRLAQAGTHVVKALLYKSYEARLLRVVQSKALPCHIGIILDGNRRYGREHGTSDPELIYEIGARKLDEVLDWLIELRILAVTLWVLSTDNLRRSPNELAGIFGALERKLNALAADPRIHAHQVRIEAVGHLEQLPEGVAAAIAAARQATNAYRAMTLTFAVLYGGRDEIVHAVRSLLGEQIAAGRTASDLVESVTSDAIGQHLYTFGLPDPDLLIRTSGEVRLSGFLLWQSAASEYYFCDVNWPALRKIDLLRAIRSFQSRQRRFGK